MQVSTSGNINAAASQRRKLNTIFLSQGDRNMRINAKTLARRSQRPAKNLSEHGLAPVSVQMYQREMARFDRLIFNIGRGTSLATLVVSNFALCRDVSANLI